MSDQLNHLLENNRRWVEGIKDRDDHFFERLAAQQNPDYLWIGCSDSRVPANEIIGLLPGEVFVHRNVANVVVHTDLNCLSVIQYAVEVLKVEHILVVGHYGCGGVRAALNNSEFGLIDNWLRHIKDVREKYESYLMQLTEPKEVENKLCELNVIEQVFNVCHTSIVQNAWKNGQPLTVRGWVYSLEDGLIRDLNVAVSSRDGISEVYRTAL
jgi:carbonic anhydrase